MIFNLFGEQKMLSYLSTLQFKCKKYVFISSPKYLAKIMSKFLTNSSFGEIVVSQYDPSDVKNKIAQYIKALELYTKIGFNLTGALSLCMLVSWRYVKRMMLRLFISVLKIIE